MFPGSGTVCDNHQRRRRRTQLGGRRCAGTGIGQSGAVDAITTFAKKVTIGEALEATAVTAGNKPVDASDAAAIQAAEAIATGMNAISGGVAATAAAAAAANASVGGDEDKTKLGEVVAVIIQIQTY